MFIVTLTHVQHNTNGGLFQIHETMQNWNVLMGRYKSQIRYVNKRKI